jgi:hypothetical protein
MIVASTTCSTCGHISPPYVLAPFSPVTSPSYASNSSRPFDITISLSPLCPLRSPLSPQTPTTFPLLTWLLFLRTHCHATSFTRMHVYLGIPSSLSSVLHPSPERASDNTASLGPRALSLITSRIISDGICAIYFALREPHQRRLCYL